jgi:3-hydroxyisobutyrate dehydrogenase-like beta-hydroxyacid dehydrogenase
MSHVSQRLTQALSRKRHPPEADFQLMRKTWQVDYGAMKFELNNAAKDLRDYAHLTESMKVPSMIGTSVHQALNTAVALGYGSEMVPSLVKAQAQLNQIKIVKA